MRNLKKREYLKGGIFKTENLDKRESLKAEKWARIFWFRNESYLFCHIYQLNRYKYSCEIYLL